MSNLVTVTTTNGTTSATVEESKVGDVLTTLISSDQALTGTHAFIQKGLILLGGMALQSRRTTGSFNFLR